MKPKTRAAGAQCQLIRDGLVGKKVRWDLVASSDHRKSALALIRAGRGAGATVWMWRKFNHLRRLSHRTEPFCRHFFIARTTESHSTKSLSLFSVPKPSRPPRSTWACRKQSAMSERKVLTKYYPPDFDPSQLGRSRGPKKGVLPTIRLETPFSMRCTRCGSFIPKVSRLPVLCSTSLTPYL